MAIVIIKQCPRCGKISSKTKGHEFSGEPLSNLEEIKRRLESEGCRVRVNLRDSRNQHCSTCAEYLKEISRGGPSRIHQSRPAPYDEDADGSWGNAVRVSEGG